MRMKVKRQKTKRQIERGKERMINNNQSNHQLNNHNSKQLHNTSSSIKSEHLSLCLEQSILKQDHATGREAAVARVPCYHSTEQQDILSDGGKKG